MRGGVKVLGVIVVLGVCITFVSRHPRQKTAENTEKPASIQHRTNIVNAAKSQLVSETKPVTEKMFSLECEKVFGDIEKFPFNSFDVAKLPDVSGCVVAPVGILKAQKRYEEDCKEFIQNPNVKLNESQRKICRQHLAYYRASIKDFFTKDVDVSKLDDIELLSEKLLAALSDWDGKRMEQVAMRLHELEPNAYEPVKALAMANQIKFAADNISDRDHSEWDFKVEKYLQEAKRFGVPDADLLTIQYYYLWEDGGGFIAEGNRLLNAFPESGNGYYAFAMERWNAEDFDGAVEELRNALKVEPKNQRFQESLNRLLKDPEIFKKEGITGEIDLQIEFNENNQLMLIHHRL